MGKALKTEEALKYSMPQSHFLPAELKLFRGWPGGADVKEQGMSDLECISKGFKLLMIFQHSQTI